MLSYNELKNGFDLALENAKELFQEAEGLAIFEHYSRAYTLYQLSIEEIGKCIILLRAVIDGSKGLDIGYSYLKSLGYFDHQSKTRCSLGAERVLFKLFEKSTGYDCSELLKNVELGVGKVNETNMLKNNSLYVGFVGDKFVSPKTVITKEMVDEISVTADLRIRAVIPMFPSKEQLVVISKYLEQNEEE